MQKKLKKHIFPIKYINHNIIYLNFTIRKFNSLKIQNKIKIAKRIIVLISHKKSIKHFQVAIINKHVKK